ncbi:MAG: hypothetical protein J6Y20_03730 [Lachnospiraceae bacterium]|nr:hypothetical protein [Lachnospiraceae bacterium]
MILFDFLMRGPDSYWKRRCHAEEIRKNKAEADLKYFQDTCEQLEEDRNRLSERDICQYRAIDTYNKEIARLRKELDEKEQIISSKDKEIVLLHEALRSERDLSAALRTNSKLWENIRQQAKEGTA